MNTDDNTKAVPPREHELGYFVHLANVCCDEALDELGAPLKFLEAVDFLYMDFFREAGDIKPATASILLLNAHAAWRAAVRLALSGQILPVFMTLRGSVESALYANAMVARPELQDVWLKRDRDENARQACRDEFTAGKMFRCLTSTQDKEFSDRIREIYDSTIDFGAHPNNHSIIRSVRIEETAADEHALNFAYIHGVGSFEVRQSLVACAEIGIAIFFVALICFEKHPRQEEINKRALEVQDAIPGFVKELGLSGGDPLSNN